MKPTALFTLDDAETRLYSPHQQAQLAADISFLFQLEELIAAHELQLQAGTPDPPEEAMDYSKVEALIKVLQQQSLTVEEDNHTISLSSPTHYRYYTRKWIVYAVLIAVASVIILWVIWQIVAWLH